jgi:hypothetical protein
MIFAMTGLLNIFEGNLLLKIRQEPDEMKVSRPDLKTRGRKT